MSIGVALVIENGCFAVIALLCIYGLIACQKHTKTIAGADLLVLGLLFYCTSALFAMGATGFTGSFFDGFTRVVYLNNSSYMYFLSVAMRLGLILVIVG
ncbi:MAG: hypothetical protein HQ583_04935, partial [Candidatus Abyssubacteria bacterium]|nr:hypothetical protein [Candidatus Abyssubacteria bacterium]